MNVAGIDIEHVVAVGADQDLHARQGVDAEIASLAVFFDNNDYKGLRLSVILDDCEKQNYRPFP
jgi:hypothetical protein